MTNKRKQPSEKQLSESEKLEDEARLLRQLKRRRDEVQERLNSEKKLEEKMSKGVMEIGKQLAEGSIPEKRLQSRSRAYKEFVRLLPCVRESVVETELELQTCCSLIEDMESSSSSSSSSAVAPTSIPTTSSKAAVFVDDVVAVP